KKYKQVRASEKTLIILMLALLLLQIGDWLHSAALLSIITVGFIILEKTEYIAQELSQKLQKLWIPAEIILFVYIGMKVDLKIIISAGVKGLIAIIIGLFFRALAVFLSTAFSNFTIKERIFCMIAYLPKATVQAALAGIPLALGIKEGNIILAVAVLSILFTTPIGVIGIKYFGNKFLKLNF
ncbi:MAG TPA: cation:proton antiporter, partial [bacterium]|nr:cation:proton antiporter [bacterium]